MRKEQPLVSVVMPTYNAERYISVAIESILNQTYSNWELIVINDGSTDSTPILVQNFILQDSRIRIVNHDSNKGLIEARNRGLNEASGKYIANLDSDDISHANRLAVQVDFLERNVDSLLVGSACEVVDSEARKTGSIDRDLPNDHIPVILLFSNYFINSTVMFRAAAVKEVGYAKDIPIAEDYGLFVALSKQGRLANLNQKLIDYRLHDDNISLRSAEEMGKAEREIQRRQLEELKIKATDSELRMHRSIVNGAVTKSEFDLAQVEAWLLRVIEMNTSTLSYDQKLLEHYCGFFYRRACETSSLGNKAIRQFRKSPLSIFLRKDLRGNFAFIVKSITKYKYV